MEAEELARRIRGGCDQLRASEARLSEIDARFGDADHGLTMHKIADAIAGALGGGTVKEVLAGAAAAVLAVSGGSAVPLWNAWLEGMAEAAPESPAATIAELKEIFRRGYEELEDISGARIGDKTMMDALIPATEAIAGCPGGEAELFRAAAAAAERGAEATKGFAAKYGRARSYGDKTIGTPDAGALSMAGFFAGMSR